MSWEFRAECISGGYPKKNVFQNASFHLEPGTMIALLGENGSGKTTLLKSVCGLLPYQGMCFFEGRPTRNFSRAQMARLFAYIPQTRETGLRIRVLDMVLTGCHARLGLLENPGSIQMEAAREALQRLGILNLEQESFAQLSEGQKQLVLLARTMVQESRIWILDEPDAPLDFCNRHRILKQLSLLARERKTAVLMSMHDPSLALNYCDGLMLLKNGRIQSLSLRPQGRKEAAEQLEKLFEGASVEELHRRDGKKEMILSWK